MEYHNVLATSVGELGCTKVLKHMVHTKESIPIRQPVRHLPQWRKEKVHLMPQDKFKRDVILPSSSPWASPVVLVQTKDGTLRFCVDYSKINAITRRIAFPLPKVDDTIDTLDTLMLSCSFSTLDLASGYW